MSLPTRIRGPRSKRERARLGYEVEREKPREAKVKRRSYAHADFVRDHSCIVCATVTAIEAHHVKTGTSGGMGLKPSDRWLVALCKDHHGELHHIGEPEFEKRHRVNLRHQAAWFVQCSPKRRELEAMP